MYAVKLLTASITLPLLSKTTIKQILANRAFAPILPELIQLKARKALRAGIGMIWQLELTLHGYFPHLLHAGGLYSGNSSPTLELSGIGGNCLQSLGQTVMQ
jgi:hypothetical protein